MLEDNSQISMLIVDDLEDNRMLLRLDLEDELTGAEIDEAEGGKEALQLISDNDYSVVICDFMMPEMDGFELFEEVQKRCSADEIPPFIFLSANKQKQVAEQGLRLGAMDFMTKPYDLVELIYKIKNLAHIKILNDSLKKSKERMAEVNKELEQINREKDDVLRIVSHDMKDPLSSIRGLSEMLKDEDYDEEDIPEFGKAIYRNSEKLLNLVNTLLEVSRLESKNVTIQKEPANIGRLIQEVIKNCGAKAREKDISLTFRHAKNKIIHSLDPTRFDQIVHNLISNAIKFTPPGGSVVLTLEPIPRQDKHGNGEGNNDNSNSNANGFKLTVADTGIGIPEEMLPTIFDKFSKNQRRGTENEAGNGLGLYIVKQLTEFLGGTIEVKSTEGEGTTFTLEFEAER